MAYPQGTVDAVNIRAHIVVCVLRDSEPAFLGVLGESLRDRVGDEVERFNEVFSAADKDETPENLENLVDAADRLMRAVGRGLIEVEMPNWR
jgi:hypothetical protein